MYLQSSSLSFPERSSFYSILRKHLFGARSIPPICRNEKRFLPLPPPLIPQRKTDFPTPSPDPPPAVFQTLNISISLSQYVKSATMLFAHHITSPAACVYPKLLTRRLSSHKNSVFFFLISSIFFCLSSACGRSIHLCAFSLLLIPLFRLRFVTLQKIKEKAIFLHFFKNIDIFVSVSPMHAMPKFNMLTILCWPNFSSTQLGIVLVVTEREVCGQGGVTGAEDENFLCAPPPRSHF